MRRNAIRGAILALALVGLTCRDGDVAGPGASGRAAFDVRAFIQRAPGDPPVPVESLEVIFRRTDASIALADTIDLAIAAQGDSFVVSLDVPLDETPQAFLLTIRAFGGGTDWYAAGSQVQLVQGANAPLSPLVAYVGPGAGADSVRILVSSTRLVGGVAAPLGATVYGPGGTPIAGVPVGFRVADAAVATVSTALLNTATLTGAVIRDSTWVYAETPTHLRDSVRVAVVPPAAQLVTVSGGGQSGPPGVALPIPFAVRVLDALGGGYQGDTVTWTVTGGAATLSATTTVTDVLGDASVVVTPSLLGTLTVQAAAPGLTGSPQTFNASVAVAGPTTVAIVAGNGQSATAGTAVSIAPAVLVTDALGNPVADVGVTFAVATGGGSVTGGVATTGATGTAAVSSWTLGATAGPNTLTATVAGLTPVVFTATATPGAPATVAIVSGDAQTGVAGTVLGAPLVVGVQDQFGNAVPGVTVGWSVSDGSVAPVSGLTDASGRAQTTWTLGTNAVDQTATATVGGLTPVVFNATATFPTPTILLSLVGGDRVPVGGSRDLQVTLTTPAGAGGVTVTVTSDNTAVVTPASPGTAFIAGGQSTGTVTLNGTGNGTTTVRANATGYLEGTLPVTASVQALSMPTTLNVPYGQTASLPLQISTPAPAGGTQVTLVSDNPAAVAIVTPTVTIAEGQQTANATVSGVLPGLATVTGTTVTFGSAQSAVATTATLNIVQTSATLNQSFGTSVTIRFESQGVAAAAPAPGITVTLAAGDPTCLAVPATVTIPTGLVQTTAPLTYGGSATTPCTTTLTASAPAITGDAINATVNPSPALTLSATTVGAGLQENTSGFLGAPAPPGLTVTLSSSNPAVALVAPNATTPGSASIDVPVPQGNSSFSYYVQGVEGATGTATITASASGYVNGTGTATVVQPALDVIGLTTATTTLTADDPFLVRIGIPNATNQFMSVEQAVRAGGTALTATVTSGTPGVGQLVTTAQTGGTVTVAIVAGQSRSPGTVATGGVAFDALTAGATAVSGTIPGFGVLPTATVTVTVTAPALTLSATTVGAGLQENTSGFLGAPAPPGLTVTLSSSNPAVALVAPNATTPGSASIDVPVPQGNSSFSYYVQGVEGATGTVTVRATASGYTDGSTTVTVVQPALDVIGLAVATTVLAADDPFLVRIGIPDGTNQFMSVEQAVRAGGTALTATVTSGTPGVGQLVTTAQTGGTVTVAIVAGQSRSPSTVATGGVAFDPLTVGTTAVRGTVPGLVGLPGATVIVTIGP